MICNNCKAEIGNASFCPHCGYVVAQQPTAAPAYSSPQQPPYTPPLQGARARLDSMRSSYGLGYVTVIRIINIILCISTFLLFFCGGLSMVSSRSIFSSSATGVLIILFGFVAAPILYFRLDYGLKQYENIARCAKSGEENRVLMQGILDELQKKS